MCSIDLRILGNLFTGIPGVKNLYLANIGYYTDIKTTISLSLQNKELYRLLTQKRHEDIITHYNENWDEISKHKYLTEYFMWIYRDNVNWKNISIFQKLSEDFIRDVNYIIDWICISRYQILSEDFIREFQDRIYWVFISLFQTLSDSFIIEFQNKVCWKDISRHQKLGEILIT